MWAKKPDKPLSPFEKKINDWVENNLSRVPIVQKILFASHLKTMTKAGLSLVDGLKILSAEIQNAKLKKTVAQITTEVEKGKQLSEVLSHYPKIFPPIYVSMIAAGEASGKLEEALDQVSRQMKKSHELNSRVRGALLYPAVIVAAMIGITIEIVFFVLPKLMVMFKDFNTDLPLATKILIRVTDFTQNYGPYILVVLVALLTAFYFLLKKEPVKKIVHHQNLKMPILGKIIKKINLARFTLNMSSLLESAIPIIEAVKITAQSQSNIIYKQHLIEISEKLKSGKTLAEILAEYPETFPPMTTEMIMVGEKTGQTENMLSELSEFYSGEVDATMKNISTIIEPVIILILGLAVAGIAVAVIMPMYSLAQNI